MNQDLNSIHKNLKSGNTHYFKELYNTYYEKLCIYALSYTNDKDLAQDIVQDTFIYIWENRKKIKITTSFNSFIYRVVYNKVMDSYRGKKKMDKSLLSYFNESLNKVVETDDDYKSLRLKKLEECLQLLPKRCQLVFLEKKVSGLKNKEIASNLNISLKTVEGHVARGYKFLKDCIKASSNSF